ncbi:DNA fragmentation factor subunit alpha [Narcine bancroftii]|uniref:DNA fragmentation factor subunit alpha n=1 Tax=Narcine bancroftii TaxID=1343680 RepID=UPI0038313D2C
MAAAWSPGPEGSDPAGFPCRICGCNRLKRFGVAVRSLADLRDKGTKKLGLDKLGAQQTCTVVLEEDGTIIDDEDYFVHLPKDTKFMILGTGEEWIPVDVATGMKFSMGAKSNFDIGESVDCVDSAESSNNWKTLVNQLGQNFAQIITMSESDLQTLIDVPSAELAEEMELSLKHAEEIQDSLQRALDLRDEQREAVELLKLFRNVLGKDGSKLVEETEIDSFVAVSSHPAQLSQRLIEDLRQKSCPELALSTRELQEVFDEKEEILASALHWSTEEVEKLQRNCKKEFEKRSTMVNCLEQLNKYSSRKRKL